MTCIAPPDLPCRPHCPGWVVERGKYLQPCAACDQWPAGDGLEALLAHVDACNWCADRAMLQGAVEPVVMALAGLDFHRVEGGWRADVCGRRAAVIVSTAVYPTREEAREAGNAWMKRFRGF